METCFRMPHILSSSFVKAKRDLPTGYQQNIGGVWVGCRKRLDGGGCDVRNPFICRSSYTFISQDNSARVQPLRLFFLHFHGFSTLYISSSAQMESRF